MKKLISLVMPVILLALGLACLSCTTFQISGIEVPKQYSTGDVLGTFDINVKVHKFLGNSAGTNFANITSGSTDPKIVEAVKEEIARMGGSKAVNVKIEYKASFLNLLLNSITSSIYAPATAHVTGTVIK
jgi:hypothetical protein